ncbi:MAG: 2-dehydro-3-deoxy-6-phosphogalactonate aldolase [Bradyrhizobium sp.]|jgi:2-dehydro-3-deoxyphosphogalactonate aldolase|uniref:2-dehydro-3-deoxy-6-phosphogalactonate aldolase n=1 Tax=Bradyrhizobium denitrificans TaxID=2734912 RepID=A0ABS5G2L4_9BRAD|nr:MULTISPECIES: 2-dehydro-3-deoxy-6-phosphogalactonate aldolase [Bradyrhizobium]RTL92141.1 MAG: 2-dehydro-3-deoxy-6-phosphogalactonate aldolase [Bradyrhizobiaceae bacterium]MBR1135547.1 2-dehydro-3-deoxy-6-phosphogalactonate aldolase [Bradyrhizobium denitrificans]MCL8489343.1 2-dehydro-3-deoxy-6-phosphogalactonate aldolase [Bradyrhizobium denitrificans]MDU0960402.1 2-dehydro-3-deoxy-6-phosphogalactonate aldolase [Bradyrhizobium sp.]MDU1494856.1 2-dehydro-3-deoxy-6-phosphogalactonate aldolase 
MTQSVNWPNVKRSLVAILRGIKPDEAEEIVAVLVEAGFEMIEVPLNSPEPFVSIERLARRFGQDCLIGAGTVTNAPDCVRVAEAGGRLMVSPNVDAEVLATAQAYDMVTMPGVFTPTEAFLALRCGASALKYFPASVLGPAGIAAQLAVLPKGVVVGAVGGVSDKNLATYVAAGVRAFGLGSSLYKPGMTASDVRDTARASVLAYDEAMKQQV